MSMAGFHPGMYEVELQPNLIEFWVCHSSQKAYQIPVIKNVEASEFNARFHRCKATCLQPEAPKRISQECSFFQLIYFFEKRCLVIRQSARNFSVLGSRNSFVLDLFLQSVCLWVQCKWSLHSQKSRLTCQISPSAFKVFVWQQQHVATRYNTI